MGFQGCHVVFINRKPNMLNHEQAQTGLLNIGIGEGLKITQAKPLTIALVIWKHFACFAAKM